VNKETQIIWETIGDAQRIRRAIEDAPEWCDELTFDEKQQALERVLMNRFAAPLLPLKIPKYAGELLAEVLISRVDWKEIAKKLLINQEAN